MITKPKKPDIPHGPEFWGQPKGMIRHIYDPGPGTKCRVYVIEESPGFRTIRFKRRKYTIFFPWVYFFVRVFESCETVDEKLYAFVSRTRAKDLDEKCMMYAPFPNSKDGGGVCMPDSTNKKSTPMDSALDVVWEFWKSNGNELDSDQHCIVPTQLTNGKDVDDEKLGSIYGKWSRMTPAAAMNMDFIKTEEGSINRLLDGFGWGFL